jgi:hypothetical protein
MENIPIPPNPGFSGARVFLRQTLNSHPHHPMEPIYTRQLNASTVSDYADLYAGLYAELKKAPQDGWRWSVRTGSSTPPRWSTRPDCAYKKSAPEK